MRIAITLLGSAMVGYCVLVRIPRDRLSGLRLLSFWLALTASVWIDSFLVTGLAVVLLLWHLGSGLLGLGSGADPIRSIERALQADFYRDREGGIRRAVALGSPEARDLLLAHLTRINGWEDEEELMAIFRALVDGWEATKLAESWDELAPQARLDFLEFSKGSSQFTGADLLVLCRRGMEDGHEPIAQRAWRTYAYTVTTGNEKKRGDFDLPGWLQETIDDPNPDIQALRLRLEQKRVEEIENQGLEGLVTRYRSEVFQSALTSSVHLLAAREYLVPIAEGGELRIPAGLHEGTLSGELDNSQNKVHEGWRFEVVLHDVLGKTIGIDATRSSESFFGEILDSQHDSNRHWFEEAPEELVRAFSLHPFVGPVVAYGDAWDIHGPTIDGETITPEKKQVLNCLVALVPETGEEGARLAFLLYDVEDASRDGDEFRPFVTSIELEHWLFGAGTDDDVDALFARVIQEARSN